MGYYMRFISIDEPPVSLELLESALRQINGDYLIDRDQASDNEGALLYGSDVYGQIEVNRPGDEIFDQEIRELMEAVAEADGDNKSEVILLLRQATTLVVMRVLNQGREIEETLGAIDPLWNWLFAHRQGVLLAEGEGYYDASGLILEVR